MKILLRNKQKIVKGISETSKTNNEQNIKNKTKPQARHKGTNLCTQYSEAEGVRIQVPGQPELHSEILPQQQIPKSHSLAECCRKK